MSLEERQTRGKDIPKSHSKLFYHIAYKGIFIILQGGIKKLSSLLYNGSTI